ncbi:tetratricopeptide repeat protein [Akanthomyces lecanii RCEF 1005]|uniref:Tetratricopeptide repeat protein n=1 Tax=Akanthomyces lecanii RCEF 1005 TaxID=1081108 RepID=A0A168FE88_CORDF|nr:tetratricopeptide repeat protein [Akanthomyces lecanii RCEF 1005]
MGINAQLHAALLHAAESDAEARAMLSEETTLRGKIASVGCISEKLSLNAELTQLRQKMRTNAALVPINQIREGQAINGAEVKQMGERLGGNVVFVDWVHAGLRSGADLLMVIFADGKLQQAAELPLKLKDVDACVAEQLDEDVPLSRETSHRQLRTLYPLVAPLAKFTQSGQVLVLSPTRSLHRIPLHALKVGGKLLIRRNPVMYCQSLSVLRMCQMAAATSSPASSPQGRPLALHPLHGDSGAAHSQALEVAALMGGDLMAEADMNKEGVKRTLRERGAPVVHFHGHVQFEDSEPLHHRLELRIRPATPAPAHLRGGSNHGGDVGAPKNDCDEDDGRLFSDADTLEADDIFDVRLPRPTHVTLVAVAAAGQSSRVRTTTSA